MTNELLHQPSEMSSSGIGTTATRGVVALPEKLRSSEPLVARPPIVVVASTEPKPELRRSPGLSRNPLMNRRARSSLIAAVLFFVGLQVSATIVFDRFRPELRDPEYGCKLSALKDQIAANPARPLLLALGSSRTEMGLRPEALPQSTEDNSVKPLLFNFGLSGAGPVQELLVFRRLLSEGIRPARLLVEVLPPALNEDCEVERTATHRLAWQDLEVIRRYAADPDSIYRQWLEAACSPWYSHRHCLLSHYAPAWLAWQSRQDHVWRNMDEQGWLRYPHESLPEDRRRRETERARFEYAFRLHDFAVVDVPNRALRELLELCKTVAIPVTLYVMPEGSEFRSWYTPAARARVNSYLESLKGEFALDLIDAREWSQDDEFIDSHHLLPRGALEFSRRFQQRILDQRAVATGTP